MQSEREAIQCVCVWYWKSQVALSGDSQPKKARRERHERPPMCTPERARLGHHRGTESSLPPATSTALRPGVLEGPDPHSNQADELRITPSKSKRRRLGTWSLARQRCRSNANTVTARLCGTVCTRMRLICHPAPPGRRTDALGSSSHQMRTPDRSHSDDSSSSRRRVRGGGPPALSSLACARIVVVTQDLDCPTTGCARGTRPTLKPSRRAPYHAVKVETETSRHLVACAPTIA